MARDTKVEEYLAESELVYEYKDRVPVRSIHRSVVGSKFQARMTGVPLNPDVVELYAQAMANGAHFPAVVLNVRDDGTYDILGGFHRVNAMVRASKTHTDAYVLKLDHRAADLLARTLNKLEAVVGANRQERVAQAMRLIKLHGYSNKMAARIAGVAESTLDSEIRATETVERLASRVDVSKLTTSHLSDLAGVQNDNVLEALAIVTAQGKLATKLLAPVIAEIKAARTEEAQLAVVRSFEATPEVRERIALAKVGRIRTYGKMRRSARLFAGITTVVNQLQKYPSIAEMALTEEEVGTLHRDWARLQHSMEKFLANPSIARPNVEPRGSVDAQAAAATR